MTSISISEIWAPVPDYEGLYEISSKGRVRSLDRRVRSRGGYRTIPGRILKIKADGAYEYVCLTKRDGKSTCWRTHRLVGITFLPWAGKDLYICHRVENAGSAVENLWVGTPSDNMQDCVRKGRQVP